MASQTGDSIYQIGLLWITLELTGSKTITGLVAMASYLPAVLLSPWAGVAADRFNRRRVMLLADAVRCLLVMLVPFLAWKGMLTPTALGLNAFAIAIAATFFNPARDSFIPEIVEKKSLLRANSLIQTSWQFSLLIGPAVAGAVLHYFGRVPLFVTAASAYAFSYGTILLIRTQSSSSSSSSPESAFRSILAGLRYAATHRVIGPLLLITIVDNLFIMGPAIVGTPAFIKDDLGLQADSYAMIEACYAIGMLLGTGALLTLGANAAKGKVLLVGMVLDGLTFVPVFWANSLSAFEIIIVIHSLAIPMLTVSRASLIQQLVPPEMNGRVFALVNLAVVGMSAISSGAAGWLLDQWGARVLFAVIGIGGGLCGLIGLAIAKQLRQSK